MQIFNKKPVKLEIDKVFMWIFDFRSEYLSVKDIVEISDYEITIDEETNAKSTITCLKKTGAKAKDIIAVKKNNEVVYWGIIDEIQNTDGEVKYTFITKFITNLFDRKITVRHEDYIRSSIENFLDDALNYFFADSPDTFVNMTWLKPSHQGNHGKEISITNVENNIYNFHTWMTNCTQLYNVNYIFSIVKENNHWYLSLLIKMLDPDKELIDTNAMNISNYTEVFETEIMSKVSVLYSKKNGQDESGRYILYLKTDRTTTTDGNDPDRAEGNITTVYTENYEDANQTALDEMKSNAYNHNITFDLDKYIPAGTPIAIKTKESVIYNTYISSVKITQKRFYEYICGNIRINFIDKLKKEKQNA